MNAVNVLEGRTGLALMAGTRGEGGHVRRMSFDKMAQGIDSEVKLQGEVSEEILKQMNVELDRVTASAREMQGVRLSVDGTYELTADGFALDHLGRPPSGCTDTRTVSSHGAKTVTTAHTSAPTRPGTPSPRTRGIRPSARTRPGTTSTRTLPGISSTQEVAPPQAPRESSTPTQILRSRASTLPGSSAPTMHMTWCTSKIAGRGATAASGGQAHEHAGGGLNRYKMNAFFSSQRNSHPHPTASTTTASPGAMGRGSTLARRAATDIASSGSSDALGVHEPRRCALRGRRRRV